MSEPTRSSGPIRSSEPTSAPAPADAGHAADAVLADSALADPGHVVLVGAGNMGGAMLRRWPRGRITVIDPQPSAAILAHMREAGVAHAPSAEGVARADTLVVAVKPQMMDAVLPALRPLVGEGTTVVSVAAGTTVETLARALGTRRVVRTIPNTPAMVGQGVTGAYAGDAVPGDARGRVEALLAVSGAVVWVEDEADIDKVTAVSGSGPAYVFHLVEALAASARALGLSEAQAETLARRTVVGAGALLAESEEGAGTLRARVTSPNGTTAAALEVLMEGDALAELMGRAVRAAHARAVELGAVEPGAVEPGRG